MVAVNPEKSLISGKMNPEPQTQEHH